MYVIQRIRAGYPDTYVAGVHEISGRSPADEERCFSYRDQLEDAQVFALLTQAISALNRRANWAVAEPSAGDYFGGQHFKICRREELPPAPRYKAVPVY